MDTIVEKGFSNGHARFIHNLDPDDPQYRRQLMTPAEIKEDLSLMSQHHLVSTVLNSQSFKAELEEIIEKYTQSKELTGLNSSFLSLQHLADLFSSIHGKQPLAQGGFRKSQHNGIIPINDFRSADIGLYSRRDRMYRCKLAAVYRLIESFGWNTSIYNHATVRLSRNEEHFLINPFGLLYHEVTASSLIKVDRQGVVLDPGSTVLGVDQAGWLFHSIVHSTRPDIRCIIHLGTSATVAMSCMKTGLLPLSQEAIILGEVAYYTPQCTLPDDTVQGNGCADGEESAPSFLAVSDLSVERAALSRVIARDTHILFVRYRGLLALGETIEEAWHYAANAVVACEVQLRLASLDRDHLVLPNQEVQKKVYEVWRSTDLGGVSGPKATVAIRLEHARTLSLSHHNTSANDTDYLSDSSLSAHTSATLRPWLLGELEFEALMRHFDNIGYRTGYLYRQDAAIGPRPSRRTIDRSGAVAGSKRFADVQEPSFTSSVITARANYYGGTFSGDESEAHRSETLQQQWSDQRCPNTPNNYTKKVSTLPGRQPIAHWVSSHEAALSSAISSCQLPPPMPFHPLTPAAVPLGTVGAPSNMRPGAWNCNFFAPQGENPKELKEHQMKIREKYHKDTNTAGPQSRLLDGLTWDEVRRIRDEALAKTLGHGAVSASLLDSHSTIAAASKAILNRDVRDVAVVYEGIYATQNPFGQVTNEELEAYRQEIEIKNNPALYADWLQKQEIGQTKDSLNSAGQHLSPPLTANVVTLQTSEFDDSQVTEKKLKKKRLFKLPKFARKKIQQHQPTCPSADVREGAAEHG